LPHHVYVLYGGITALHLRESEGCTEHTSAKNRGPTKWTKLLW